MEPALPLPLRLQLSHAAIPMEHESVSESIASFLTSYAARTGTHNAASSSSEDNSGSAVGGSTGGVVAAQLTRLMNGLAGKIDYDAFSSLISGLNSGNGVASSSAAASPNDMQVDEEQHVQQGGDEDAEAMETPAELLDQNADGQARESFSKQDELSQSQTPTLDDSLTHNPIQDLPSSPSKTKKVQKDKKDKKEKKDKRVKKEP
ncbi:uncharacterized protein UTRI_05523_B [Ustilago trichophora]|uniref:Uncharacterized protein n=1 Tax=Ustilago trichophora TaxID=86804 RepID=A0A5C3EL71_9BASI|nr:uncharacterized protein UTRI_05523_B [Ustilago trichophora]